MARSSDVVSSNESSVWAIERTILGGGQEGGHLVTGVDQGRATGIAGVVDGGATARQRPQRHAVALFAAIAAFPPGGEQLIGGCAISDPKRHGLAFRRVPNYLCLRQQPHAEAGSCRSCHLPLSSEIGICTCRQPSSRYTSVGRAGRACVGQRSCYARLGEWAGWIRVPRAAS